MKRIVGERVWLPNYARSLVLNIFVPTHKFTDSKGMKQEETQTGFLNYDRKLLKLFIDRFLNYVEN